LNIALDATYSLGEELSGVGIYSRELLLGLAQAHPDAKLFWYYRPHRFLRSFALPLPKNCRRRLLLENRACGAVRLFHGLNQRLPAWARSAKLKTVSTFHDLFVLSGDYSTPEFRRRFAGQARGAAAGSDAIIAVSRFTATQVTELLGVERSRVHVVHHGVRPLPRPKLEREKVILHVGAIQKRKNLPRLVQAFEKTPADWRLVLAGSAGYGASQIRSRIESSPCRDRIQVLGYVPAELLAQWYARALIFAFPSLDEGFGLPVLEAMAAGVAVISSNRAALPEVCGDAALLIDPERTEALSDALQSLICDEGLRRELAGRGLRRVSEFTWSGAVEKTWKIYGTLVG
jgi:glycosyltransferase involved in cell wall biosynthesis